MTAAVTRARVCQALRVATCPVPDFLTRNKTSLVWSKVYISIQDGKLCFIELNLLQRIIRYLIGSYVDTILDIATLNKVKDYVHSIKTATDYNSIATILLEEVRAKHDYSCLRNMLRNCNDREVVGVMEASMEMVGGCLEEGFSDDFLSVAITLAKQNLKRNPDDMMWQSITEAFPYDININTVLSNEGLLREILGLPYMFQLPSQCIIVQDKKIEKAVIKRLQKVKNILEECLQIKTLRADLKILDLLEKIDKDKELPEVLRPYCFKIEPALKEALLSSRVYPSLVEAYLEDKKQIAGRLFYHMYLGFVHPLLSDRNASRGYYINAVMNELRAHYGVAETSNMTWREQIGNELFKAEHRVFADRRAKELTLTLNEYFQWIEDPQSSIALPELELLSKITGRPVVIVFLKKKEPIMSYVHNEAIWYFEEDECIEPLTFEADNEEIWHAEWIDGINLSFDKEPIIFNIANKENWSPVEWKKYDEAPI